MTGKAYKKIHKIKISSLINKKLSIINFGSYGIEIVTPGILTPKKLEFLYWIVTSSKEMPRLKKQECVIKYGVHGLRVVTPGRLTDQKIKFLYKLFN